MTGAAGGGIQEEEVFARYFLAVVVPRAAHDFSRSYCSGKRGSALPEGCAVAKSRLSGMLGEVNLGKVDGSPLIPRWTCVSSSRQLLG